VGEWGDGVVIVVPVELGSRSYNIHITSDGPEMLVPRLASVIGGQRKIAVITDKRVEALYGPAFCSALRAAGYPVSVFAIAGGERSKTPSVVTRIWQWMMSQSYDRKSTAIISLGGGVPGDIGGFVAATYMRGVDFIQVPTTLLAQVDSSVGGKTGVNLPGAKNGVGAFYQPRIVFSSLQTLHTLSTRDYRAGLGEVVKHGVIGESDLIQTIVDHAKSVSERDSDLLGKVVAECCEIKRQVVEKDEREAGLRRVLNFGHTFGHAIEVATKHRLRHGEAVALGMVSACRVSARLGLCGPEIGEELTHVLKRLGLKHDDSAYWNKDVVDLMVRDKKMDGNTLGFVIVRRFGDVSVVPLALSELKKIVSETI